MGFFIYSFLKVLMILLFIVIFTKGIEIIIFIFKMLNPNFFKQYISLRKICNQIKKTGNLNLLKEFDKEIENNKHKYKFYYDNDNTNIDEIYEKKYDYKRKFFIRIMENLNYYSLENCVIKAIKKYNYYNNPDAKYFIKEIKIISSEYDDETLSKTEKILNSKKRFLDYLIINGKGDKEYFLNIKNKVINKLKNKTFK